MTNRIRRSFKIRSMDSEYSEFDATSTNTQNQGNIAQVNPLSRPNLNSNETPVRGNIATQLLRRLNWRNRDLSAMYDIEDEGLMQLNFSTVKAATNNFSEYNKLGEGGFGTVYKGTLPNGQEIAVKRLSRLSRQGELEFKNEVRLVSKLQHRNLVGLRGFCFEGEEKILVYEFMTNKSLYYFLFDPEMQGLLDWTTRYKIIGGIARGILYLHEDSPLRIIHCDLKPSNILLDVDMNPKISDFGLAKLLAMDQTQGNTCRITGTYGYMAPEYAMEGLFSVKSDVYSFGVLILEIISGKRNWTSFYDADNAENLVGYRSVYIVWKHWRDGTPLKVLDPTLTDTYSGIEAIRCIQIGLLCVQEDPESRPTIATIVDMLNSYSYSVTLPLPQEPAYFGHDGIDQVNTKTFSDESKSKWVPFPSDVSSITEVYPR